MHDDFDGLDAYRDFSSQYSEYFDALHAARTICSQKREKVDDGLDAVRNTLSENNESVHDASYDVDDRRDTSPE